MIDILSSPKPPHLTSKHPRPQPFGAAVGAALDRKAQLEEVHVVNEEVVEGHG